MLALAALDDDAPPLAPAALSPPGDALPASIGPVTARPHARSARPRDEPVDLFTPPDAPEEIAVELAADEIAHRARRRMTAPPETAVLPAPRAPLSPAAALEPIARRSTADPEPGPADPTSASAPVLGPLHAHAATPVLAPLHAHAATPVLGPLHAHAATPVLAPLHAHAATPVTPGVAASSAWPGWSGVRRKLGASPRTRLAAGVFLAIVLGFIPADLVASLRERGALRAIDTRVAAVQAAVDSQDSYDALDAFRADQLEAKRSKHRMIVVTAMLVWAVAGGGLGYVWFNRVRWDQVD